MPVGFCPYASTIGQRLPAQPASLKQPGRVEPPEEPELVDEPELLDVLEPEDEPELLLPAPEPLEDSELPEDPELAIPPDPALDDPELLVELEPPVGPGFPPVPLPPQAGTPPTKPLSAQMRTREPTRDTPPTFCMASYPSNGRTDSSWVVLALARGAVTPCLYDRAVLPRHMLAPKTGASRSVGRNTAWVFAGRESDHNLERLASRLRQRSRSAVLGPDRLKPVPITLLVRRGIAHGARVVQGRSHAYVGLVIRRASPCLHLRAA